MGPEMLLLVQGSAAQGGRGEKTTGGSRVTALAPITIIFHHSNYIAECVAAHTHTGGDSTSSSTTSIKGALVGLSFSQTISLLPFCFKQDTDCDQNKTEAKNKRLKCVTVICNELTEIKKRFSEQ